MNGTMVKAGRRAPRQRWQHRRQRAALGESQYRAMGAFQIPGLSQLSEMTGIEGLDEAAGGLVEGALSEAGGRLASELGLTPEEEAALARDPATAGAAAPMVPAWAWWAGGIAAAAGIAWAVFGK